MFTNFYCVVRPSGTFGTVDGARELAAIPRSATFDIQSRGAGKKRVVVGGPKGIAHRLRPLVGDVIRPSPSRTPTDGADVEVRAYRWTGDEATTTKFNPVADVILSLDYPGRGDGRGLGFGTDDELLVLTDARPEDRASPVDRPTIKNPAKKKQRFSAEFYSENMKFGLVETDA